MSTTGRQGAGSGGHFWRCYCCTYLLYTRCGVCSNLGQVARPGAMLPDLRTRLRLGAASWASATSAQASWYPLRTVDAADAAVAAYARSLLASSGGPVWLGSAVATDQRPGQVTYRLRWGRLARDLTLITVVQRWTYLGGVLSSWHVVPGGTAPAASSGGRWSAGPAARGHLRRGRPSRIATKGGRREVPRRHGFPPKARR